MKEQSGSDEVLLKVKVIPGSSRTTLAGFMEGMLRVKVAAPPEKGKANKELIAAVASKLGLKKKDVEIVSGQTNPQKVLRIRGLQTDVLKERLFS